MAPNFNEMNVTTLRNRGNTMAKKATKSKLEAYEGSPKDIREDKKAAKRMGMTAKEYEGSPADRRSDIRSAVKKAVASSKKSKKY